MNLVLLTLLKAKLILISILVPVLVKLLAVTSYCNSQDDGKPMLATSTVSPLTMTSVTAPTWLFMVNPSQSGHAHWPGFAGTFRTSDWFLVLKSHLIIECKYTQGPKVKEQICPKPHEPLTMEKIPYSHIPPYPEKIPQLFQGVPQVFNSIPIFCYPLA